jgi:hypothetical protein
VADAELGPSDPRQGLAAEVQRLADDPADAAERHSVMDDMEALAAEWPA